MWVHPDLVEGQQWTTVTNKMSKDKAKVSSCIVECASSQEAETDVPSLTSKEVILAVELNKPLMVETRSGQSYLRSMTRWWQALLNLLQNQPSPP